MSNIDRSENEGNPQIIQLSVIRESKNLEGNSEMNQLPNQVDKIFDRRISVLQIPKNNIHILNKESEGEIKIKSIECLKMPVLKVLLFILLSILSIGVIALFAKWFIKFRKFMLYSLTDLENSTHFYITSTDKKYYIEQKEIFKINEKDQENDEYIEKDLIFFTNNFIKYVYREMQN